MPKYEELVKEKNKGPVDIEAMAKKYNMSVTDVKQLKDDRGPLDLTRQIGELQCEIAGLKTKVHDAELETSLVKAVGMNSPEMKAAKAEITQLKETLKSRDYTRQHDYQFLIDENLRLEQEKNEVIMDNKKLSYQIEDQVNRLRKAGM